jgi:dihydropteroate synthase/2-amino-4-hydroxy-6-hydroxymethyldihydropteridine diphosphokinase
VSASVLLGLGTNLGDRKQNLIRAVHEIDALEGVSVRAISAVYETEPWGLTEQPHFLNMAVSARTSLPPPALLAAVKEVEQHMGRERTVRWGPRLIDVDLLFYDDLVQETDKLIIPHPRLAERAFVLAPLADIAPEQKHPQLRKSVRELLAEVDASSVRRLPLPLEWGWRTYVMGILNVTPDSFSGDGVVGDDEEVWLEATVTQARQFIADGVDIIDIGGESTRPGSTPVTREEELRRVLPVLKAIRLETDLPLSLDTYRADVAVAGLEAGADWVNDVWGLRMDPRMAAVVAEAACPVVLMHNRSRPKNVDQEERLGGRYVGIDYDDLLEDIKRELQTSITLALEAGVAADKIIVDPGIGFGKTVTQNVTLLDRLDELRTLGYPLLIGPSRKSFIGYTLDLPPAERMEGTAATVTIGIDRGADIVRVHDVREMVRVARMTDRITRRPKDR